MHAGLFFLVGLAAFGSFACGTSKKGTSAEGQDISANRAGIELYESRLLHRPPTSAPPGRQISVTWFGTTTLLLSDGETALLTDGFFTRPGGWITLGRNASFASDGAEIDKWVGQLGAIKPSAILLGHAHHDHAMDTADVAQRTGAPVLGSTSVANVVRGHGLDEDRIQVVTAGEPMKFGQFTVTFIASRHGGDADMDVPGPFEVERVERPLAPPAGARDYKEGDTYSILLQHPLGTTLIHESAGWIPGHLRGVKADIVLLGIGGFGKYPEKKKARYWAETVEMVGATRTIPIHWDDFTVKLDRPIQPLPFFFDDVDSSMKFLVERTDAASVKLDTLAIAEPTVLFPER